MITYMHPRRNGKSRAIAERIKQRIDEGKRVLVITLDDEVDGKQWLSDHGFD